MARQKPQRIGEIQVSPTITQTNTFVQASEGIDATGAASYDFSDAILNAAPQIAKAVGTFSEKENKELAEAGYAIAARVNKGEKLEKVVADYLGSESTPNRLRSQLAKWVENGKITKSANPFFRRAYEETTSNHRADHAEIEMATKIDELVGAMKGASSEGQSEMIQAGEEILAGYIGDNPQLYDNLSQYGAAQLRELLTKRGNKIVGVALARAEDEMTSERVQGEFAAVSKGFDYTIDIEAKKATRLGEDLDIDPEQLFESTPMHIAFGHMGDNLKDIGDPTLQRKALKNTVNSMIDSVYLNPELSVDDRTELVHYLMAEAASARTNDGNGPHTLSRAGEEMQSIIARGKQVLKQLSYAKDNDDSDRTAGIEWAMAHLYDEPWMSKDPEDWTDADTQRRQEVLQTVTADYGGGFLQGVLYVERGERDVASKVRGGEPSEEELVEITNLKSNPMSLYDYEGESVPFGGDRSAQLAWAKQGNPSQDLFKARLDRLSKHNGIVRGEIDKHTGSRVSIVRHALKPEHGIAYEDLGSDTLTSAVASEEENKVLLDGAFQTKMLSIDAMMRNGTVAPQAALELRRSAAVEAYRSLPDNPTTYTNLAKEERKKIDETRQKMSDPEAAGEWVGYGAKYTVNVPKSPLTDLDILRLSGSFPYVTSDVGVGGTTLLDFHRLVASGDLFDDAAMSDVKAPALEKMRSGVVKYLDGRTKLYIATRANINQPNFDTLGTDYIEFLKEPLAGLGGPGSEIYGDMGGVLGAYSDKMSSVFVDDMGDYRFRPDAIPSLSVLGMPDNIRMSEMSILYPQAAAVGESSAAAAYGVSKARLRKHAEFVTGTGDAQKMVVEMDDQVGVDPLVRRVWSTSQSLFKFSQGQEYDERNVSHRRTMSYIWLHVSSSETRRTVKR
jgi:hypothetical protein